MKLPWRKTPRRRRSLGTGREPRPDELCRDPNWRPSKIKAQGGAQGGGGAA